MREQINGYFEQIKNFEPFDWLIVIFLVIVSIITPKLLKSLFYWVMKVVFKLEPYKWIKGWRRIE